MFNEKIKPKLLLVEDNKDQLYNLKNFLDEDYEVFGVTSFEEAIKHLSSKIDIIVTDLNLDPNNSNDRSGIELLKEAKIKIPEIPVILMTAYGRHGLANEVLRLGGFQFLSKPLDLENLEAILKSAIKKELSIVEKIKSKVINIIPPILFFFIFLILWEIITRLLHIPLYIFPSPSSIFTNIFNNFELLLKNMGTTASEALLGFIVGGGFAFLVAVVFAHSAIIEKSIYPYFIALQAVPLIAIAPLLVIWFGNGIFGKLAMSAIICFFPIVVNTTVGLKSIKDDEWDLLRLLSASKFQIFTKLRFPSSLPFLFSAMKISITLSVIGAIVAELAGSNKGLGFMILISSYRTDTVTMFSAIIFSSILGIALFLTISTIEKRYKLKRRRLDKEGQ